MKFIADLHFHSKYSRAVSPQMVLPEMARWAKLKGIDLLTTTDFTHPLWLRELKAGLEEAGEGVYKLKVKNEKLKMDEGPLFIFTTEISSIYTQGGKLRRIHNLVFAPNMQEAEKIGAELARRGNVMSDGRPIFGLSAREIADLILNLSPQALIIPAHCLLPNTYLMTNPGIKMIKDFKERDKVLTYTGEYHRVEKIFSRHYSGSVYTIKPWYFRLGLTTTPEHPFLAIKSKKNCLYVGGLCKPNSSASGKHKCQVGHWRNYSPSWIPAASLEKGDVLLYPRLQKIINKDSLSISSLSPKGLRKEEKISAGGSRQNWIKNEIKVDERFCLLAGYYLAEGYSDGSNRISFALSNRERKFQEEIKNLMKEIFGLTYCRVHKRKKFKGVELIFFSKILAKFFVKLFYSDGERRRADTKALPHWTLYLPKEKQKEILVGWWRGDTGYTSSRILANQMKIICLRLGIMPSILVDSKEKHFKRGKHTLGERLIKANFDNFWFSHLTFFEDPYSLLKTLTFNRFTTKLKRYHGWVDDNYVYLPIRDIKRDKYEGLVYNLEVEKDNSYVAEFATVHNCWTPHFSLYGSESGFDSIEECFGDYAKYIYAVETGLSSSPEMNWRIKELDNRSIISCSDAHSGAKLGREATVFEVEDIKKLRYKDIRKAIMGKWEMRNGKLDKELGGENSRNQDISLQHPASRFAPHISYTIEFYPEEGKYHYTGHRNCQVRHSPEETRRLGSSCPVCGKGLTVGVMHRVEQLAKSKVKSPALPAGRQKLKVDGFGVRWINELEEKRPPYVMLVPLLEILAESLDTTVGSQKAINEYNNLTSNFGGEFGVLLNAEIAKIAKISGPKVAEAVKKVRSGDIVVEPGYDGVFGRVKIWGKPPEPGEEKTQMVLF